MPKKRRKSKKRVYRKKPCKLCKQDIQKIDFKDTDQLSRFVSDRGKIMPTRITGNCAKHQRMVSNAVKQARIAALLPVEKVKVGGRRRRGGRGRR